VHLPARGPVNPKEGSCDTDQRFPEIVVGIPYLSDASLAECMHTGREVAMTTIWNVLSDSERPSWVVTPLEQVGPLVFGMTTEQIKATAFEDLTLKWVINASGELLRKNLNAIYFDLKSSTGVRHAQSAVVAYVDNVYGLSGVAVDARGGPQVTLGGIPLVGQTPSILQDSFAEYLMNLGEEIRYTHEGNLCAGSLGVVLRAQRAGDLVPSRPLMVAGVWAENCWDGSTGRVPRIEWNTF
jgi:hypothetical protein